MQQCEFLEKIRRREEPYEKCALNGHVCYVLDGPIINCVRRTWALGYLSKRKALNKPISSLKPPT